ncbi:MAG: hypothetical protein QGG39_00025 [Candidatus Poribacteria bacterium]|nr:hypothetical protein [Candidatus Poribacteria bacterium]
MKRNPGKPVYPSAQAHQFAAQRHRNHLQRRISFQRWRQIEALIRQD